MLCRRCGHYIDFDFSTTDIDDNFCESCWNFILEKSQKIIKGENL